MRRGSLAAEPIGLYHWLRPFLFALEPEKAHRVTLALLKVIGPRTSLLRAASGARRSSHLSDRLARTVAGIRFANPIGLAAGYDKDAAALPGLAALGFGFLEIGTITPRAQPGNPAPRVARIPRERALANALGFPNAGAAVVARRIAAVNASLAWRAVAVPIAVSIGKMRETAVEDAAADYVECLSHAAAHADFIVVNVSSPNTPGLTRLQESGRIDALLDAVARANAAVANEGAHAPRPLFAKLSPDLDPALLDEIVEVAVARGLAGVVLTNTLPVERAGVVSQARYGLSGAPIRDAAHAAVARARGRAGSRLALIGAGGIMSAADALARLDAGADLIQLYTGLVYEGPGLIGRILDAIAASAPGASGAGASAASAPVAQGNRGNR